MYRDIREMSDDPLDVDLARPAAWLQMTKVRNPSGETVELPLYANHLMCDADGMFPADINQDEREVLKMEMSRPGFVAWYRNPSRSSQDSLGIAYTIDDDPRIVRPDFICFSKLKDGSIVADIIDPHGTFLSDSLPKLEGLARYAEKHKAQFRRIDAIAGDGSGGLRVLDMTEASVRKSVLEATNAASLFSGNLASKFVT